VLESRGSQQAPSKKRDAGKKISTRASAAHMPPQSSTNHTSVKRKQPAIEKTRKSPRSKEALNASCSPLLHRAFEALNAYKKNVDRSTTF
jgi:hypothetical protein